MPIQSQSQAQWLQTNRPDLYKKWQAEEHRELRDLPLHKTKARKQGKALMGNKFSDRTNRH